MQKNEISSETIMLHKNQLHMIKDLKMKLETLKLLEENEGSTLPDVGVGKDFMKNAAFA